MILILCDCKLNAFLVKDNEGNIDRSILIPSIKFICDVDLFRTNFAKLNLIMAALLIISMDACKQTSFTEPVHNILLFGFTVSLMVFAAVFLELAKSVNLKNQEMENFLNERKQAIDG